MMKLSCAGIVHFPDGIMLVRDAGKEQWRLPEREITDLEDVVMCIRRCVLMQTGYRTAKLRFYKIQTHARSHKRGAFIRFIFGCEIGDEPLQAAQLETKRFTPDELVKLADRGLFNEPLLLDLVLKYRQTLAHVAPSSPLPL